MGRLKGIYEKNRVGRYSTVNTGVLKPYRRFLKYILFVIYFRKKFRLN